MHSPYWFFPIFFSLVSLVGFYLGKFYVLDTGILLSIISYLFVNRGFDLNIFNILLVIGPFFLFVGVWFYARNTLTIKLIENVQERSSDNPLSSFRKLALVDIFNNLLLGSFLALIGSILGIHSSLDIGLSSDIESILMVFFSLLVFFMIYIELKVISSED